MVRVFLYFKKGKTSATIMSHDFLQKMLGTS